jgi:hypothetical protein
MKHEQTALELAQEMSEQAARLAYENGEIRQREIRPGSGIWTLMVEEQ